MKKLTQTLSGALATVAALFVTTPAMAALPTTAAPSRGATSGDFITLMQDYSYDLGVLAGLLLSTVAFLIVVSNAIGVYTEIARGRRQWSDLGGHMVAGVLLLVFSVYLLTEASNVL